MVQSAIRTMQGAVAFVILCEKDIMGENFIQNVVTWSVESIISYLCESIVSSRYSLDSAILCGKISLLVTREGLELRPWVHLLYIKQHYSDYSFPLKF